MVRKAKPSVDLKKLSKGYLRKLTALRKSLGEKIADAAFVQWMSEQTETAPAGDPNVRKVTEVLSKLAKSGEIRIPRGGLLVTRGRGRVIVQRAKE